MLSGDTTVDEFCAGLANLYVPRKYIMYGTAKQQECNSKDKLLKCVSTLQIVGNHLAHGKTSRSRLQYKNKSIRISHLTLKGVGFMGHKSSQYSDSLQAGKVGDWIPVGGKISAPTQTGPGAQMGTGSFPGIKWQGHGINHPPSFSIKVKGRVELHLYSPSVPWREVIGWSFPCRVQEIKYVAGRECP